MIAVIVPLFCEPEAVVRSFLKQGFLDHVNEVVFCAVETPKPCVIPFGAIWHVCSERGRAMQMNEGAASVQSDYLWFVHVDTQVSLSALDTLKESCTSTFNWSRFDVCLDDGRRVFRVIEAMMNWRSDRCGIATGDQAVCIKRELFEQVGGFPRQLLMEDVEMSMRLKAVAHPYRLRQKLITSARKWQNHGVVRTVLLMWKLRFLYAMGAPASKLFHSYYKN